jgi:RNA recognition motif-containing protein
MRLGDSDKIVRVTEFLSRTERGDPKRTFTNLYVKNLPENVKTKEDLEGMFTDYGTISSAVIMEVRESTAIAPDPYCVRPDKPLCIICSLALCTGTCSRCCKRNSMLVQDQKTSKMFGFVNFETAEAAAAAKEAMHDKEIDGRKLFVDRAQTKTERQACC